MSLSLSICVSGSASCISAFLASLSSSDNLGSTYTLVLPCFYRQGCKWTCFCLNNSLVFSFK